MSGDIYYAPGNYGLEIALEVEAEQNWDFHKFVVWRELATGRLLYGTDSGCSCPSPFENFHGIKDLTAVSTPQELHDALDEVALHDEWGYSNQEAYDAAHEDSPWAVPPVERGEYGPTGRKELNSGWREGDVAEGHRKISELRFPGTGFGGYAVPEAA